MSEYGPPIIDSDPPVNSLNIIGEGTYGIVYDNISDIVKIYRTRWDYGFNSSMLREISVMLQMKNSGLVPQIYKIYLGRSDKSYKQGFTMEKYKRTINDLILENSFDLTKLREVIFDITLCLAHAQTKLVLHRDIKPENILINDDYKIAVTDWGSALIQYSEQIKKSQDLVQTLQYRSPEHLLRDIDGMNNNTIDMWSVGIMMMQIITGGSNMFKGETESDQIEKIAKKLGSPKQEKIKKLLENRYGICEILQSSAIIQNKCKEKNLSDDCVDFITRLLEWSPHDRLDPISALFHPYLRDVCPNKTLPILTENNMISKIRNLVSITPNPLILNYINCFNPEYAKLRNDYIEKYCSIISYKGMGTHELALMIMYTDTYMSSMTFDAKNDINNLVFAIANIIDVIFDNEFIEISELLEIFPYWEPRNVAEIISHMNNIFDIQSFPLFTSTFVSYKMLLSSLHSSVGEFYEILCDSVIKQHIFLAYTQEETYGTIINTITKFCFDDGNIRISFSDILKEHSKFFSTAFTVDISSMAEIKCNSGTIYKI